MTDGYLSRNGRRRLFGETSVQGSKNSALPCLRPPVVCVRKGAVIYADVLTFQMLKILWK